MKKRDPSLTIRALITAAEALFTQKGYYPVTIKELGEKAGCSPAHYFLLLWRQERPIPRCRGPTALDH